MESRAFRIRLEMYCLLDTRPSKLHNYFELKYHYVREALLDYLNHSSASLFFITISPLLFFMAESHFETEFLFDFYHVSSPVDCKFHSVGSDLFITGYSFLSMVTATEYTQVRIEYMSSVFLSQNRDK